MVICPNILSLNRKSVFRVFLTEKVEKVKLNLLISWVEISGADPILSKYRTLQARGETYQSKNRTKSERNKQLALNCEGSKWANL